MKNILIALDYDPTAEKVAETGYQFAKSMNATVVLLHVISDIAQYTFLEYSPVMGFAGFNTIDKTQRRVAEKLDNLAQEYLEESKKHLGDENIQALVKSGDISEVIMATASEVKADIIVMGTHRQFSLEKMLIGSVAQKVLRHSSIPMLIVPAKGKEE